MSGHFGPSMERLGWQQQVLSPGSVLHSLSPSLSHTRTHRRGKKKKSLTDRRAGTDWILCLSFRLFVEKKNAWLILWHNYAHHHQPQWASVSSFTLFSCIQKIFSFLYSQYIFRKLICLWCSKNTNYFKQISHDISPVQKVDWNHSALDELNLSPFLFFPYTLRRSKLRKRVWAVALNNLEWNLALSGLATKEHTTLRVQTVEPRNSGTAKTREQPKLQALLCQVDNK